MRLLNTNTVVAAELVELIVGTHNGVFHADEVTSLALLRVFGNYDSIRVIRSRDADILKGCHILVDVGGEYDVDAGLFDHHQKSYCGSLSSAGMIFKALEIDGYPSISKLVKEVDDQDTGSFLQGQNHFCGIVSSFNDEDIHGEAQEASFHEAVDFVEGYLLRLKRRDELAAKQLEAAKNATTIEVDGVTFADCSNGAFIPSYNFIGMADFAINWDSKQSCYMATAVPLKKGEFGNKFSLLPTGRKEEVFCHKAGFTGGYKSISYGQCMDGSDGFKSTIEVVVKGLGLMRVPIGDVYYR